MYTSNSIYNTQDFGMFDTPSHTQQPASGSPPGSNDSQIKLRKRDIQLEPGKYLCPETTVVSSKDDPFQWWDKNKSFFPNLAQTACKWISFFANLTASERLCSFSGVAMTTKRLKIRGRTLEAQILLKKNLPCSELSIDDLANAL